jgi:DNA-binding transcriptional LysR family regulator
MPRILAEPARSARVSALLLTEPETEWRLTMIWRRGAYLSHAARAWLEMVQHPGSAEGKLYSMRD